MLMIHCREAIREKERKKRGKKRGMGDKMWKRNKTVVGDSRKNTKNDREDTKEHVEDRGRRGSQYTADISVEDELYYEEEKSGCNDSPLSESEFLHALNSKVSICQDTILTLKELKHSKCLNKFDNMANHLEWMLTDIHRLCLDQFGASNMKKYAKPNYSHSGLFGGESVDSKSFDSNDLENFHDALEELAETQNKYEEEKVLISRKKKSHEKSPNELVKISSDNCQIWNSELSRDGLPVPKPKVSTNIFRILKDCIGKDLGHFAVPVYFNEPISMLQRVCEPMQNDFLLSKASCQETPELRMVYYAAFCIAQYAGSHERLSKPFNPILGETFEFATPKWKFIAEQVSHHPPISACHVIHEDYSFWTNTHVKSKFWGKSIEFKPLGVTKFKINSTEEVLTCTRPSTYLHGFLIGHKYLDHNGEMKITMDSPSFSETPSVKIKFHKLGLFGNLQKIGKISGEVYDSLGRKVYEIFGNCTREINYKSVKSDCDSIKLWEFPQQPENWDENYRFTDFTLKLNMLTEEMKEHLPPTDSRFRLDQAYLEKGDLEKAGEEKFRLEEKQRRRRKRHQKEKFIPKPLYFVEDPDSVNDDFASYIYKGGYWNHKNTKKWDHLPDLFGPDSLEL